MGVAARIGRDLELLRSDAFTELCRSSPADFTRRRKMPCDLLVESVVARKGRTLRLEVREFARGLRMAEPISVPGYAKARWKLEPGALLELARHHAAGVYSDGEYDTYRGMLLVAIDGSTANVPTNPETIALWGSSSSHGRDQATMGLSGAFDVVNRQMIDLRINRGGFDERAQVPEHLEVILSSTAGARVALVLDRGYPSSYILSATSRAVAALFSFRREYGIKGVHGAEGACRSVQESGSFRKAGASGPQVDVD